MADVFSIEFPILIEGEGNLAPGPIGESCTSNTNYYTSGAQRATCCCGCDKE